jgi:hypothetical protein
VSPLAQASSRAARTTAMAVVAARRIKACCRGP